MEEYYIRILLISEIEKNYNLSYDLETTKKLTLKNTKNNIIKYIITKYIIGKAIVKPNTIEDYLMDELNGNITNNNFDAENIYKYIFPYILDFIDHYMERAIN
jgi:hypothetical protein